jgi:hypothetical protein
MGNVMPMKIVVLFCLLIVGATAYSEETAWPAWYTNLPPADLWCVVIPSNVNTVAVSTNDVDLFIWVMERHRGKGGPLFALFGVRNMTEHPIEMEDVEDSIMPNGVFCCQKAEGAIVRARIPPVFHRKMLLGGWSTIPPGQTSPISTPIARPLTDWFWALKSEGRYLLWWEYRGKKSSVVTVEQTGKGLRVTE